MGPLFILEPGPEPDPGAHCGLMALPLLLLLLLAAGAAVPPAVPPAVPAPRELARSVLETHGQELRLLRLLGVARTVGKGVRGVLRDPAPSRVRGPTELLSRQSFDWGTHFSINFTARQPPCPKPAPDPRGCRGRPGRVSAGWDPRARGIGGSPVC